MNAAEPRTEGDRGEGLAVEGVTGVAGHLEVASQ